MRAVIQRVSSAQLRIDNQVYSEIGKGMVLLLGIENDDTTEEMNWLISKILNLRLFNDANNKMNLDIFEVYGEILLVSQFTLFASIKKGNRPSFTRAAKPEFAKMMYEMFKLELEKCLHRPVKTGVFAADMKITLVNDGPVTIIIDTKNKE